MNNLENLKKKYSFQNQYVENFDNFKEKIKNKTIIPYQVEFQPPPKSTKKICAYGFKRCRCITKFS